MKLHLLQLTQEVGTGAAQNTAKTKPISAANIASAHKAALSFEQMFISDNDEGSAAAAAEEEPAA